MDTTCFDDVRGNTFWSIILESDCTTKPVFIIYKGQANKTTEYREDNSTKVSYYHSDDNSLFLLEVVAKTRICGYESFISQHPSVFVSEIMENHKLFKRDKSFSIKNIDTLILHSFKLSLMYNDIATQVTGLYANMQYTKCSSDQKLLATTLSLAQLDPNSLGLSLFNKPGYFTKIAADVIYVVQCKAVEVTLRPTKDCYNELPVLHNGKPKFMSGRSKLLVEDAVEISCVDSFQPLFYLNNVWYIRSGTRLIESSAPQQISFGTNSKWSFHQDKRLSIDGIYSREDIENYRKSRFTHLKNQLRKLFSQHTRNF